MRPFFIIGAARSGTTLLASMLGSHECYISPPECQFKKPLLQGPFLKSLLSEEEVYEIWDIVANSFRFKLWGIQVDIEEYLDAYPSYDLKSFLEWLVKSYALQVHGKGSVDVWFDHDPSAGPYAKQILEIFPEARFIHIVRDGRAVYASFKNVDWGPNTPRLGGLFWKDSMAEGKRVENEQGEARCLRVYYEDLLKDPEDVLKRICDWGGLEFKEHMLDGQGFLPPSYTVGQHHLVRSVPRKEKMKDWRNTLSKREIELFERTGGDCLSRSGYSLFFSDPRPLSFLERCWYFGKEFVLSKMNEKKRKKRKAWGVRMAEEERKRRSR